MSARSAYERYFRIRGGSMFNVTSCAQVTFDSLSVSWSRDCRFTLRLARRTT